MPARLQRASDYPAEVSRLQEEAYLDYVRDVVALQLRLVLLCQKAADEEARRNRIWRVVHRLKHARIFLIVPLIIKVLLRDAKEQQ